MKFVDDDDTDIGMMQQHSEVQHMLSASLYVCLSVCLSVTLVGHA